MTKPHRLPDWQRLSTSLGQYKGMADATLADMVDRQIIRRIWAHDHTVWKPEPTEITNRLGWLRIAEAMGDSLQRLQAFAKELSAEGYTHALLLGMGGSSLAPEVFRKTFGVREGYLDLAVLDSTDPDAVLACADRLDLARTLFIVSTKSGGTVETLSFFKFFYNRVAETVGTDRAGEHFIAITDPNSKLEKLANQYNFRTTFLNDPNIGGRYSALSYFGLVPAALIGMDVELLLERAKTMARNCENSNFPIDGDNHGAQLGAMMGELTKAGRDKLTLILSPAIDSFGDWVEQLVAESTGKEGQGILPVVGEPLGSPSSYGDDRLFVYLQLDDSEALSTFDDKGVDVTLRALEDAGHPVVDLRLRDRYDLGEQIFLWEMATAVAGHRLGINPFDQPNVEAAKVLAKNMVTTYQEQGTLPDEQPAPLTVAALQAFLAQAQQGDGVIGSRRSYIAIHAYVTPTPETDAALHKLRTRLRNRYRLATTVGYGPRFLHSTGQLHKGDAGNGLFIQFTSDPSHDIPIPDEAGSSDSSITFGVLKMAQALGDKQALLEADRPAIRFHLGHEVAGGLEWLAEALGKAGKS